MSSIIGTIGTYISGAKIPPMSSQTYSVVGGNIEDYYSLSVTSDDETSVLTVKNGWYASGQYKGAYLVVTNPGSTETTFNIILFSASQTPADSVDIDVVKIG